jgi:hypothetical protein
MRAAEVLPTPWSLPQPVRVNHTCVSSNHHHPIIIIQAIISQAIIIQAIISYGLRLPHTQRKTAYKLGVALTCYQMLL